MDSDATAIMLRKGSNLQIPWISEPPNRSLTRRLPAKFTAESLSEVLDEFLPGSLKANMGLLMELLVIWQPEIRASRSACVLNTRDRNT